MDSSRYLLVDIGNSRIKWATAGVSDAIHLEDEIGTKDFTPERACAWEKQFADHYAVISSVVPSTSRLFGDAFRPGRCLFLTVASPGLGLRFNYPEPEEIGADRLAAAAAVAADAPGAAIIAQCGTATAFTVLDHQGRVCGGAIAPGLQAQLAALTESAALLPETDLRQPENFLARSTEDAVRSGVILSFQGGVKEILHRLAKEVGGPTVPRIVITGGNTGYLTEALDLPYTLRPLLVLEGLRMIGTRSFSEPILHTEE